MNTSTFRQSLFNETTGGATTGEFDDLLVTGNLTVNGTTTLDGHTLTVTSAQWAIVEAMDQYLSATSAVNFLTVNGRDVAADGAKLDTFDASLQYLTASEIAQLVNIDAVTISNTQWGYVGALDQNLTTSSSPTFSALRLSNSGNTITISAPTLSASSSYTLPATDGKSGQVLGTDGAGVLNWQDDGMFSNQDEYAFSSDTDSGLKYVSADELALFTGATNRFTLSATAATLTEPLTITDTTGSTSSSTGSLVIAGGMGIGENLYVGGSATIVDTSAGVGTSSFNVFSDTNLGTTAGDYQYISNERISGATNSFYKTTAAYRDSSGSDWASVELVDFLRVDASFGIPDVDSRCAVHRNPFAQTFEFKQGGTSGFKIKGAGVEIPDGTAASPGFSFLSDTDTGIYRSDVDNIDFSVGGTQRLSINAYGVAVRPSIFLIAESTQDATSTSEGSIRSSGGMGVAKNLYVGGYTRVIDGTAAAPAISFASDTDTGIYSAAADTVGISTGGSQRLSIGTASATLTEPLTITDITDSLSKETGSLILEGGLGVKKSIVAGGHLTTAGIASSGRYSNSAQPFQLRKSSADQSIVTSTLTNIDFQTSVQSSGTLTWDSTNKRFQSNWFGYYLISVNLHWDASVYVHYSQIVVNSVVVAIHHDTQTASGTKTTSFSCVSYSGGTNIEVQVYHTFGSNIKVLADSSITVQMIN